MTVLYFIQRVQPTPLVQWTGSNLAEVETALSGISWSVEDTDLVNNYVRVPLNKWTDGWTVFESVPEYASGFNGGLQQVPGPGPFDCVVTEP